MYQGYPPPPPPLYGVPQTMLSGDAPPRNGPLGSARRGVPHCRKQDMALRAIIVLLRPYGPLLVLLLALRALLVLLLALRAILYSILALRA